MTVTKEEHWSVCLKHFAGGFYLNQLDDSLTSTSELIQTLIRVDLLPGLVQTIQRLSL